MGPASIKFTLNILIILIKVKIHRGEKSNTQWRKVKIHSGEKSNTQWKKSQNTQWRKVKYTVEKSQIHRGEKSNTQWRKVKIHTQHPISSLHSTSS